MQQRPTAISQGRSPPVSSVSDPTPLSLEMVKRREQLAQRSACLGVRSTRFDQVSQAARHHQSKERSSRDTVVAPRSVCASG